MLVGQCGGGFRGHDLHSVMTCNLRLIFKGICVYKFEMISSLKLKCTMVKVFSYLETEL